MPGFSINSMTTECMQIKNRPIIHLFRVLNQGIAEIEISQDSSNLRYICSIKVAIQRLLHYKG